MKITKKVHKSKSLTGIFLVLFLFFSLCQVFLANSISVQGKEISRLNGLKLDLEKEIEVLEQGSQQLSSLETVRKLALEKLQMVDGLESFDYISTIVALR